MSKRECEEDAGLWQESVEKCDCNSGTPTVGGAGGGSAGRAGPRGLPVTARPPPRVHRSRQCDTRQQTVESELNIQQAAVACLK